MTVMELQHTYHLSILSITFINFKYKLLLTIDITEMHISNKLLLENVYHLINISLISYVLAGTEHTFHLFL